VGSRTEIFLKTAVFPHTSPRHNFNDCINELESLGVRESDRRNAEKAVLSLPAKINSGVRSPETVGDLIAHYRQHELTLDRKAFATVDAHTVYIKNYVNPKWGACKLSEVKTVAVEQWLESLPLAPASQSKIRNIMSAISATESVRVVYVQSDQQSSLLCQTLAGTGRAYANGVPSIVA
jgi:hypothetical protein